jgi:hypothetical protein
MAAALKAGPEGSTTWLWVRLTIVGLLLAVIAEVVLHLLQWRSITIGRVPMGWPFTDMYYITTSDTPGGGDVLVAVESHFEPAWGPLAANLAIFTGGVLLLFVVLRLYWVASKPKPRPVGG